MKSLASVKSEEFFNLEYNEIEKTLARNLLKIGLIPNKKFKLYFKNFGGSVIIGDNYLKIALNESVVKKIIVSIC